MKKALNNPLVVGVLVVLALAFVLRDFIHLSSMFAPENKPSVAQPALPQPLLVMPAKVMKPKVQSAAPSQLTRSDWSRVSAIPLTNRDPFSPQAIALRPPPFEAGGDGATAEVNFPPMDLRAIVSAADVHYASINGKLWGGGASLDGWKLVAIGVDRVQLRGEQGLLTLDIDGGARMGGKALKMTKKTTATKPKTANTPSAASAMPGGINSVGDLNMYQGLFDSLIKSGIVPNVPALK